MKLIKPYYEILEQPSGIEGMFKMIELAGRTAYKSEDRTTEDSAPIFVDKMIKSRHFSVLEHGTVYLYLPPFSALNFYKYRDNAYSVYRAVREKEVGTPVVHTYITTSYRVLLENGWLEDLQYMCEPTEYHQKRYSVRFVCDRGISHELVRHRAFSFTQESTRYCNYSKGKFGGQLTFIIPSWCDLEEWDDIEEKKIAESIGDDNYDKALEQFPHTPEGYEDSTNSLGRVFICSCRDDEDYYKRLVTPYVKNDLVCTAQQARQVLPNALKTEVVMTGFSSDWEDFFRKRTSILAETGMPHPDMAALCDPLYREFVEKKFINELK